LAPWLVTAVLLGTVATAAALVAAAAARETLRRGEAERRREGWRRLEEAVRDVHRAASAYQRTMDRHRLAGAGADRAGGAAGELLALAADRYQECCERLSAALSAGASPGAAGTHLPVLLDASRPERVAQSPAAELVLAELARLRAQEELAPSLRARARRSVGEARAFLVRLRSAYRLARLARDPGTTRIRRV